jgi:hypothetical protein
MKDIAQGIRKIVDDVSGRLVLMTSKEVSAKATPESWSKKEILGHLIDSAANNHQRFVRACYNAADGFPPYSQNDWVRIQQYNESDWDTLITLWTAYNRHLAHLIERLPQDALSITFDLGKGDPVTLEFIVKDYLRHLRHHVDDLLA